MILSQLIDPITDADIDWVIEPMRLKLLDELRRDVRTTKLQRRGSVSELRLAAEGVKHWLDEDIAADIWLPLRDQQLSLRPTRYRLRRIVGNLSKHNFLRSIGVVGVCLIGQLLSFLTAAIGFWPFLPVVWLGCRGQFSPIVTGSNRKKTCTGWRYRRGKRVQKGAYETRSEFGLLSTALSYGTPGKVMQPAICLATLSSMEMVKLPITRTRPSEQSPESCSV